MSDPVLHETNDPERGELRGKAVAVLPNHQPDGDDHAREALSQGILDSVVVGVMQFDRDARVTYVNAFARQTLQFTGVGFQGGSLSDYGPLTIWPDGSPCPVDEYPATKCLRTGKPEGPTTIGLRSDSGETRWVTISAVPALDPVTGEVQGAVATFVDVSHARQIEESLQQTEDRYRRLVEEAPDAIVVHQQGKIVFVNNAGVRLWAGKSRADFLGRSIFDFTHPRYRELVERRVQLAQRGGTAPLLDQLSVRLDGRNVRVEVKALPCVYDGQSSVQVILRDVTERRRVERQVRRQREILRRFFDRIPLFVAVFNAKGRIKIVNREWKRVFGFGIDASIYDLLESFYPDPQDRRDAEEYMHAAPPGWRDSRVHVQGGRVLIISWATIVLSDGTRIAIGQDITERKQAARALRQHKDELERHVEARTEELVRKNEQLLAEISVRRKAEADLHDKQQILKHMLDTHERYRQLLSYEIHDTFVQDVIGAMMFLDVFHDHRSEAGDVDLEDIAKTRALLEKSIAGARRTISGLRPPIIDEQGVVAAIEYLVSEMNAGGMEIQLQHDVHFERVAPLLEAAIFRIVQEGLVNVQRHSKSVFAQVSLVQQGDMLRVQVRDFGVGFDPTRVDADHFGLQGIRDRAAMIGGEVSITSAADKGTEIVAQIPLAAVPGK